MRVLAYSLFFNSTNRHCQEEGVDPSDRQLMAITRAVAWWQGIQTFQGDHLKIFHTARVPAC